MNTSIQFYSKAYFSWLRYLSEPEISELGTKASTPSRRSCAQDFYVLKNPLTSVSFEPEHLGSRGKHASPRQSNITIIISCIALGFHCQRQCTWCLQGWWAVVSGYKFLTFRLHLWQTSSGVAASTVASEVPEVVSVLQ